MMKILSIIPLSLAVIECVVCNNTSQFENNNLAVFDPQLLDSFSVIYSKKMLKNTHHLLTQVRSVMHQISHDIKVKLMTLWYRYKVF